MTDMKRLDAGSVVLQTSYLTIDEIIKNGMYPYKMRIPNFEVKGALDFIVNTILPKESRESHQKNKNIRAKNS